MRATMFVPLLIACQTDTGFQNPTDGQVVDVGNGVLAVSTEYLNFDSVELLFAESITFVVTSAGDEPLDIYNARVVANPGAAFTFEEKEDLVLAPGDSQDWTAAAYITAEGKYEGSLRIESNDATFPTLYLSLCAASAGYAEPCPVEVGTDDSGNPGDDTGDTGGDSGDSGV